MKILLEVDNGTVKDTFLQIVKNNLSDEEVLFMTRLFFISESINQNADQAIDFLANTGLLHYLKYWSYLPKNQAERIVVMLAQEEKNNSE